MTTIIRYTCRSCGLVTRVEEGQDYRVCVCNAGYDVEIETDVTPVPPAPEVPNEGV